MPPLGGLTRGLAGTSDPQALVDAQAFPVQTLSMFDIATQKYLSYIPGAPAYVSTLNANTLKATSIVAVKRATTGAALSVAPTPIALSGPRAFLVPPLDGLTQGIAGTTDLDLLLDAQTFEVQTVSAWDVATQRFLTFIPGAPAYVSTLSSATLEADMVVMMRRGVAPSAASVPNPKVDQRTASITYYYCTQGANPAGYGDGGGWCGGMANGEIVYEGAASCSAAYLGQQFKILGDPTARTYTCADTGGGVTDEHRDIFFNNSDDGHAWWLQVGSTATIEIVS
ncbi:MAG: hypothetical protein O3A10_02030 [Chloroflexi bacterium]|nr:hypothetical protein [Chloroflexota bacterium]MDA1145316.1 hypothetical protein [Chloroflexota bacterium]